MGKWNGNCFSSLCTNGNKKMYLTYFDCCIKNFIYELLLIHLLMKISCYFSLSFYPKDLIGFDFDEENFTLRD